MKRTMLLTHEYPPFRGGIAAYCYNLVRHFSQDRCIVVTDQRGVARSDTVIPARLLGSFIRPRWRTGVRAVMEIVHERSIEMILTPHILPLGQIAYQIKKKAGIPYCISLHGLDINLALASKPAETRKILANAEHIIVNSHSTESALTGLGLSVPVTVISPCLDADRISAAPEAVRALRERYRDKNLILSVGRLVRRKGQDTVIAAMPDIISAVPEAHYCIIGSGPAYAFLKERIHSIGMAQHVEILLAIADRDLGAFYSIASLFALPTRREGQDVEGYGIVFLEASHFGLPIIAGNSGGEREIIDDGATGIIHRGDAGPLADTIIALLKDRKRAAELGSAAKKKLGSFPSWAQQSKRLEQILS